MSKEDGKGKRIISRKVVKGGTIVRREGRRGWRPVTWQVGKGGGV